MNWDDHGKKSNIRKKKNDLIHTEQKQSYKKTKKIVSK